MIRVSIVEDDQEIRESLAILIRGTDGFDCISTFEVCETALEAIEQDPPDLMLMDINLPGMSGIEGVRRVKEILPETEILMLTISDNDQDVFDSLCAGASGYLKKNIQPVKLLDAIRETVNGGAPMSMAIARMVVNSFQKKTPDHNLTEREQEVLSRLCEGKSYKMIAGELFIDINTVKFHIRNIYRKLEVNSKGEAIAKALREDLVAGKNRPE